MYGAFSGLTSGMITSTNATINDGTYTFKNMGQATYSLQNGDSGAPILFYDGNYGGVSRYSLVGIHEGQGGNARFFSKYAKIVDELGISAIIS